jgi:hypothetical protein
MVIVRTMWQQSDQGQPAGVGLEHLLPVAIIVLIQKP